jgi:hypothetical protein
VRKVLDKERANQNRVGPPGTPDDRVPPESLMIENRFARPGNGDALKLAAINSLISLSSSCRMTGSGGSAMVADSDTLATTDLTTVIKMEASKLIL